MLTLERRPFQDRGEGEVIQALYLHLRYDKRRVPKDRDSQGYARGEHHYDCQGPDEHPPDGPVPSGLRRCCLGQAAAGWQR